MRESFKNRVDKITNGEYSVESDYVKSSEKVYVHHVSCGNYYWVTPNNFLKGRRCPYCAGKIVNFNNSLTEKGKSFIKEWDSEKNKDNPSTIAACTNKKVWWKCAKGHRWMASPNSRMQGTGCPICYRSRLRGYSLENTDKIIAILDKLKLDYILDYRIKDCRIQRAIPFSIAILKKDKVIGLLDYHTKYYSKDSRWAKEDYCNFNNIPYYCAELVSQKLTDEELVDIEYWIKNIKTGGDK